MEKVNKALDFLFEEGSTEEREGFTDLIRNKLSVLRQQYDVEVPCVSSVSDNLDQISKGEVKIDFSIRDELTLPGSVPHNAGALKRLIKWDA